MFQTRDRIRKYVEGWLKYRNRSCSDGDIHKIIKILENCKNGIPKTAGCTDEYGKVSNGFYIGLLDLEKYETDPKLFYELLEIDQKIGWTNADDVETRVFYNKGIKIIEDQNVSLKKLTFRVETFDKETNLKIFIEILMLELVKMAQMARRQFGGFCKCTNSRPTTK